MSNHTYIKQIFLITLSETRYELFKHLKMLIKFNAIDSRSDSNIFQKYNMTMNIVPQYKNHYDKCKGAIGCFLSHHTLWKQIANHPIATDYFLILEDDVLSEDVLDVYNNYKPPVGLELINLNQKGSAGSDAYLMNSIGASKLLKCCNNVITHPTDRFLFQYAIQNTNIQFVHIKNKIRLNIKVAAKRTIIPEEPSVQNKIRLNQKVATKRTIPKEKLISSNIPIFMKNKIKLKM